MLETEGQLSIVTARVKLHRRLRNYTVRITAL